MGDVNANNTAQIQATANRSVIAGEPSTTIRLRSLPMPSQVLSKPPINEGELTPN